MLAPFNELMVSIFDASDSKKCFAAFLEKRPDSWKGR